MNSLNNNKRARSLLLAAKVLCLFMVSGVIAGNVDAADLRAVTDEGREVLLRDDGSWVYIQPGQDESNAGSIRVSLDKAVIQKRTTKVQKNKRVRSQMMFEFNLLQSADAASRWVADKLDTSLVAVTDNAGEAYEVKTLQLDSNVLQPGEATRLAIKVNKSPGWLSNAKYIEIVFQAALFSSGQAIKFRTSIDDIETVEVDNF